MKWSTTAAPNSLPLTDASPMPWGIHQGKPMAQLPVEYLHFLWHDHKLKDRPQDNVSVYIKKCIPALRKENKDLLWS
jgi:uncharacterized protein (DUF3820 family)